MHSICVASKTEPAEPNCVDDLLFTLSACTEMCKYLGEIKLCYMEGMEIALVSCYSNFNYYIDYFVG